MATCVTEGCNRQSVAKRLCGLCYQRSRFPERLPRDQRHAQQALEKTMVCRAAPCTSPVGNGGKGFCRKHYVRTLPQPELSRLAETARKSRTRRRGGPPVREVERERRASLTGLAKVLESKRYRLRTYGLTPEGFKALWDAQQGQCAICQEAMDPVARRPKSVCVDHKHGPKPWKVRALLCRGCNSGIGHFYEKPEAMEAAAKYIRAHSQR